MNKNIGWPMCAVCRKPVDLVESMYHPQFYAKVYRVHCHGATETGTLSALDIENSHQIEFGWAFAKLLLEESNGS